MLFKGEIYEEATENKFAINFKQPSCFQFCLNEEIVMKKENFDVAGMTCSACSTRVQKAVAKLAGVQDANVNLLKNSMSVSFDESQLSVNGIISAVDKAGYNASLHQTAKNSSANTETVNKVDHELHEMKQRLWVSILFTLPLFYIAMGSMVGLPMPAFLTGEANIFNFVFTQFLLTLPVVFINFKYYRVGFKTLFSGAPNMDSLIAIGSGAAVVFGIYALYRIGSALTIGDAATVHHFEMNLYFESAAVILTLITLGKYLEARAKGKTSDTIEKLMNLTPKTATVLRNGVEERIASETVQVGDIVAVKAGETVPVDGVITEGHAFVDESAITGESIPVEKQQGDRVTGATINKSGYFLMNVTQVGEETVLAKIVKLVDEATSSKAPIARLADKISGIFVPVVISIAVIATAIWLILGYDLEFALSIGISVLVISCPCALGLATPTAIMVGMGRGASTGILIKSAEALETLQSVDTVILDKTGTVTEGRPAVTDIIVTSEQSETDLLTIAASLEKLSEHPLAAAIVAQAEQNNLTLNKVTNFAQIAGQGICGMIDGASYFAGNKQLLMAQSITLTDVVIAKSDQLAEEGKTVLYFVLESQLIGLIAVADKIKQHSKQAVAELDQMGINVVMLTGDNAKTAEAVRRLTGINQVIAEVLPQDKEQQVRLLQDQGKKVAMVGDGINDAPALARANVGVAIGAGTDIAIESADIVLMKSDLLDVVSAVQLSKAVIRNIRQNLFWAFFYNIAGIPIAAGVFYGVWRLTLNPMIAAAAMSLSSVCVVSNALRLRWFEPKHNVIESDVLEENLNQSSVIQSEKITETVETDIIKTDIIKRSPVVKNVLHIEGMSCGHCSGRVEKALRALPGVQSADVDLAAKTATIESDGSVSKETLTTAVTEAGYDVTKAE